MVGVLSSLALKGVLEKSRADFERAIGTRLELRFDATQAILAQLAAGASADLLVLTTEAMQGLQRGGKVTRAREIGSSGVGVAVRAGAPKPDIGTVDALKRTLASAASVAHSKVGASGIYFAELIERLAIKLKKRVIVEKGPVGLVWRGERPRSVCSSFASSRRSPASTLSDRCPRRCRSSRTSPRGFPRTPAIRMVRAPCWTCCARRRCARR